MEDVVCNLCGSSDHESVYSMPDKLYYPKEIFTVVRCKQCGLGFVNPRPTEAEMGKYYPSHFYQGFSSLQKRYNLEQKLVETYSQLSTPGSILDVGCACGHFPLHMQTNGWKAEGFEKYPPENGLSGFKRHTGNIADINSENNSFDVITSWAVLEHTHNPMEYFQTVSRLLKSGGVFIFLVTNFDSLASRALYREDIPRHLYFFTHSTAERFCNNAGLTLKSSLSNKKLFGMAPIGFTRYYFHRYILGKEYRAEDAPITFAKFREENQGENTKLTQMFRYAWRHPELLFEITIMPIIEAIQILRKTYGITIYIATKP